MSATGSERALRQLVPASVGRARQSTPTALYDDIADWYSDAVRTRSMIHDLVLPQLTGLAGEVAGRDVCDLGCGEGVVARELARSGARVVGVDLSPRLLALAEGREARDGLGIRYRRDDGHVLLSQAGASFDAVVSNLALADMEDLPRVVTAVARVLRPGGCFVFSVNHPCGPATNALGGLDHASRDYFAEGYWRSPNPLSVRGRVGAYHRTLSTYCNALAQAGFGLEASAEPKPTGTTALLADGYDQVPAVWVSRWRRGAAVPA